MCDICISFHLHGEWRWWAELRFWAPIRIIYQDKYSVGYPQSSLVDTYLWKKPFQNGKRNSVIELHFSYDYPNDKVVSILFISLSTTWKWKSSSKRMSEQYILESSLRYEDIFMGAFWWVCYGRLKQDLPRGGYWTEASHLTEKCSTHWAVALKSPCYLILWWVFPCLEKKNKPHIAQLTKLSKCSQNDRNNLFDYLDNCQITESLSWEKTSKDHLVQHPCSKQSQLE